MIWKKVLGQRDPGELWHLYHGKGKVAACGRILRKTETTIKDRRPVEPNRCQMCHRVWCWIRAGRQQKG